MRQLKDDQMHGNSLSKLIRSQMTDGTVDDENEEKSKDDAAGAHFFARFFCASSAAFAQGESSC